MTKYLKLLYSATAALSLAVLASCNSTSGQEEIAGILSKAQTEGKVLFGHQDDLMYGHSWNTDTDSSAAANLDRSDVKDVCGDYPAVLGMDLGGIELSASANLDKCPFERMRRAAALHYERGGIVTFSWHPRNPLTGGDSWDVSSNKVVASILPGGEKHELFMEWLAKAADFFESIKTSDGRQVPLIFRPWHEHTGSWFWWGRELCTTEEYIALFRMTYEYMVDDRGLDQILWAYSPNIGVDRDGFMERYPGDEYVQLIGIDAYQFISGDKAPESEGYADRVAKSSADYRTQLRSTLSYMVEIAEERGKLAALTEAGFESIPDPQWWTGTLLPALEGLPISYVLVWRNAWDNPTHFYAPYPGSSSADDFLEFHANDCTVFLSDLN